MWMFNEDFSDDSDLGSMDSLPDIGFGGYTRLIYCTLITIKCYLF